MALEVGGAILLIKSVSVSSQVAANDTRLGGWTQRWACPLLLWTRMEGGGWAGGSRSQSIPVADWIVSFVQRGGNKGAGWSVVVPVEFAALLGATIRSEFQI